MNYISSKIYSSTTGKLFILDPINVLLTVAKLPLMLPTRNIKDIYRFFDTFINIGSVLKHFQSNFPQKHDVQLPELPHELEY